MTELPLGTASFFPSSSSIVILLVEASDLMYGFIFSNRESGSCVVRPDIALGAFVGCGVEGVVAETVETAAE